MLFFGLVRPYKGVDLLVEAFAVTPEDAVLLVVGMPRTPIEPLERRAQELGIAERVRFVPHFVPDEEVPSYFRRADMVVLPYREIDQSGVLYTALAFGSPLLLSAVGGFPEIAARGAARLVEPGSVESLRAGLVELLEDAGGRRAMRRGGTALAAGEHSWDAWRRRPSGCTGGCWRTGRDGGRDRILGVGGPDRLHACGLSAAAGVLARLRPPPRWRPRTCRTCRVIAAHDEGEVIEQRCAMRWRSTTRPTGWR